MQYLKYVWRCRTRSGVRKKCSWGGFYSVAYGDHLHLMCAVFDVTSWRHIHVSRSGMSTLRLRNLAILSAEQQMTNQMNFDIVIEKFANVKARKDTLQKIVVFILEKKMILIFYTFLNVFPYMSFLLRLTVTYNVWVFWCVSILYLIMCN